MSLLDDLNGLEANPRPGNGPDCAVARILSALPGAEAARLSEVIDANEVYGTKIAETLRAHGFKINGAQVQHHRKRQRGVGCKCPVDVTWA